MIGLRPQLLIMNPMERALEEEERVEREELLIAEEADAYRRAQESDSDDALVSLDEPLSVPIVKEILDGVMMERRAHKTANLKQKNGEVEVLRKTRPSDQMIAKTKLDAMEEVYASQTTKPDVSLQFDSKRPSCVFTLAILKSVFSQGTIENLHIILNDGLGYVRRFCKNSSHSEVASYFERMSLLERYFTSSDAFIVIFPAGIVYITTDREYMESHYYWKQMMGLTPGYEEAAGVYNRQMYFGDPMKNNFGPMFIVCMTPPRKVHIFCERTVAESHLFETDVDDRAMINMPGGYLLETYPKNILTITEHNSFQNLIRKNLWAYVV